MVVPTEADKETGIGAEAIVHDEAVLKMLIPVKSVHATPGNPFTWKVFVKVKVVL